MNKDLILDNINKCDNGCWEWLRSCNSTGYGQTTINGSYITTHRLSFILFKKEIPDNLIVRHKCHNSKCCNPEHLELGTHKDNYQDSIEIHSKNIDLKKVCIFINNIKYKSIREANKKTGITFQSLTKFRDKNNIFDIKAYREGCKKANVIPKI